MMGFSKILSQNGKMLLVHNNEFKFYHYRQNKNGWHVWRCVNQKCSYKVVRNTDGLNNYDKKFYNRTIMTAMNTNRQTISNSLTRKLPDNPEVMIQRPLKVINKELTKFEEELNVTKEDVDRILDVFQI